MYPEGYQVPALEPGLGKGPLGEHLVAGPLSMVSGQAQPEKETWFHTHMGPPPTGVAIDVQCYVDWVAVKGRGLGNPIPGH